MAEPHHAARHAESPDPARIARARTRLTQQLLDQLGPDGHWIGELSSSALSTATAVTALATVHRERFAGPIHAGLRWLAHHQNSDGGWGDTVRSRSNLSTTSLVWAAFGANQADDSFADTVASALQYIRRIAGDIDALVPTIEALYSTDRTFSVPITMTLALSGRLGPNGWKQVRSLPFELAILPRQFFGALRLPVVSYALPALIAIGQVIHQRSGRYHPLRDLARNRTLDVLTGLQPENGGFLEATPLTSFVTMSLAGMGLTDHIVTQRGAGFLLRSMRPDGSWPIDTNLATWVTTLAIKALAPETLRPVPSNSRTSALSPERREQLRSWLLRQQHRRIHPYTGAAPGGWAWTDLPGGVPDADDTAGALIALHGLGEPGEPPESAVRDAALHGVEWLLNLQNRDGGIPTFCKGWGTLPFDRSTPEITAHALRAWALWRPSLPPTVATRIPRATERALRYLEKCQRSDGAWLPLWFGNEHAARQENPVYGTAQVLIALSSSKPSGAIPTSIVNRAARFLASCQHQNGAWGGDAHTPASIEETALATEALSPFAEHRNAQLRGLNALLLALESPEPQLPAPIGLYFARLWYFERLYPIVFALSALRASSPTPPP